jgi:hypothetical protein
MTPPKPDELRPDQEQMEAARSLYEIAIRAKSFKEAFAGLAQFLAARDVRRSPSIEIEKARAEAFREAAGIANITAYEPRCQPQINRVVEKLLARADALLAARGEGGNKK